MEHYNTILQQLLTLIPRHQFERSVWWFRHIHEQRAFFVTRIKTRIQYRILGQQEPLKNKGILMDGRIERTSQESEGDKPMPLRLIRYQDKGTGKIYEFITNNITLSALTIAEIYKARWRIEAFFKWIKQNLKIKTFLGTSKNAAMTQILHNCYNLLRPRLSIQFILTDNDILCFPPKFGYYVAQILRE